MDLIRHTHIHTYTHTRFLNSCLMPNFDQDQENRRLKESQTRGGGGGRVVIGYVSPTSKRVKIVPIFRSFSPSTKF